MNFLLDGKQFQAFGRGNSPSHGWQLGRSKRSHAQCEQKITGYLPDKFVSTWPDYRRCILVLALLGFMGGSVYNIIHHTSYYSFVLLSHGSHNLMFFNTDLVSAVCMSSSSSMCLPLRKRLILSMYSYAADKFV